MVLFCLISRTFKEIVVTQHLISQIFGLPFFLNDIYIGVPIDETMGCKD